METKKKINYKVKMKRYEKNINMANHISNNQ